MRGSQETQFSHILNIYYKQFEEGTYEQSRRQSSVSRVKTPSISSSVLRPRKKQSKAKNLAEQAAYSELVSKADLNTVSGVPAEEITLRPLSSKLEKEVAL